jgi:hypothetical protein
MTGSLRGPPCSSVPPWWPGGPTFPQPGVSAPKIRAIVDSKASGQSAT